MTDSLASSCGHFKTDFVQTGIGYHWILDGSIPEVKSLPHSTTVERINCRSEVNSMDSEFPARNHFPFSWHSPPVQKKGRHEEDIIQYSLMTQKISAAIYILKYQQHTEGILPCSPMQLPLPRQQIRPSANLFSGSTWESADEYHSTL